MSYEPMDETKERTVQEMLYRINGSLVIVNKNLDRIAQALEKNL